MEKAFFTNIRSEIIPLLNNARNEVLIAMAWFTSAELFEALLSCRGKGVRVELILLDNPINYMYYAPDFNQLIKSGGSLWIAKQDIGFMHHKFCVIDDKIAITGSYNWTYYAETRNIENIVITDNPDIVNRFSTEFNRLTSLLPVSSFCARLSWDDIEAREDIDFRELNYEIERICEVQNKPVRRIFETRTEVVRTEIKKIPFAKYSIGILVCDNRGTEFFDPFINSGTQLPYHSTEKEYFFDSKHEQEFHCKFIYEKPNDQKEPKLIKEVDLMQIAKGTCDENLPVRFAMSLDDNGSLKVDVACTKSGQRLTISALDSNFVKYE
ncbi:MAG: DUF1669 domain-containing protein [Bacteroidaceae bacterium]|nr:DUF1669 domain-containing protein [Bacteroidaceae bacterium]